MMIILVNVVIFYAIGFLKVVPLQTGMSNNIPPKWIFIVCFLALKEVCANNITIISISHFLLCLQIRTVELFNYLTCSSSPFSFLLQFDKILFPRVFVSMQVIF